MPFIATWYWLLPLLPFAFGTFDDELLVKYCEFGFRSDDCGENYLREGRKIYVLSQANSQRACTILENTTDHILIHYDGEDQQDEWLPKTSSRIQPQQENETCTEPDQDELHVMAEEIEMKRLDLPCHGLNFKHRHGGYLYGDLRDDTYLDVLPKINDTCACAYECRVHPDCAFWQYEVVQRKCYFRTATAAFNPDLLFVSGSIMWREDYDEDQEL